MVKLVALSNSVDLFYSTCTETSLEINTKKFKPGKATLTHIVSVHNQWSTEFKSLTNFCFRTFVIFGQP